mmetsp:Transcript_5327/g.8522  ORF Transcript_5327/g.8522 Transcript_5327/m.8522 type:complete len:140 (-) Transcript_5327:91-510(-)
MHSTLDPLQAPSPPITEPIDFLDGQCLGPIAPPLLGPTPLWHRGARPRVCRHVLGVKGLRVHRLRIQGPDKACWKLNMLGVLRAGEVLWVWGLRIRILGFDSVLGVLVAMGVMRVWGVMRLLGVWRVLRPQSEAERLEG